MNDQTSPLYVLGCIAFIAAGMWLGYGIGFGDGWRAGLESAAIWIEKRARTNPADIDLQATADEIRSLKGGDREPDDYPS